MEAIKKLEVTLEIVKLLGLDGSKLTIGETFPLFKKLNEICEEVINNKTKENV